MTTKQYNNEEFVKNLTTDQLAFLRTVLTDQQKSSELVDLVTTKSESEFHHEFTTSLNKAMNTRVYECLSQLGMFEIEVDEHRISYIDNKFSYTTNLIYSDKDFDIASETNPVERDFEALLKHLLYHYYEPAVSLKTDDYRLHLSFESGEDETMSVQELVTLGTVPITSNLVKDINHLVNQLTKDDWSQLTTPLFTDV